MDVMTNKSDDTTLPMAVLAIVLWIPRVALSGYVLTQLWGWFVEPLGVPPISIFQGAGLFALTAWMSGTHRILALLDDDRGPGTKLAVSVAVPLGIWALGALWHWLDVAI